MIKYLINCRKIPVLSKISKLFFLIIGLDIPKDVIIEDGVEFPHNSVGTVIHPNTVIKKGARIYQNVTIGRADIYLSFEKSKMEEIVIEEGAILCAGSKVLSKDRLLVVGKNSIIAANSVLLNSTGENEIWGGIPAKKIGNRKECELNVYD